MGWQIAGKSDTGVVRASNQDNLLVAEFDLPDRTRLACLLVADGMGGHSRGESASYETAVTVEQGIARLAAHSSSPNESWCSALIEGAHQRWKSCLWEGEVSGTTATLALIHRQSCFIGHVGDSRAYLVRNQAIERLTNDQTWEAESERRGTPNPGGAALLQAVGVGETLAVETRSLNLQPRDRLLVCSDGLYKMVEDEDICKIVSQGTAVAESIDDLISLASVNGGTDNITVCLIEADVADVRVPMHLKRKVAVGALMATLAAFAIGVREVISRPEGKAAPIRPKAKPEEPPLKQKLAKELRLAQGEECLIDLRVEGKHVVPLASIPMQLVNRSNPVEVAPLKGSKRRPEVTRISMTWEGPNMKVRVQGTSAIVHWDEKRLGNGAYYRQAPDGRPHLLSWTDLSGAQQESISIVPTAKGGKS